METINPEPRVLVNRRGVAFDLPTQGSTVDCVITLAALEAYFWLEPGPVIPGS
jgi:hypothetical protein